MSDSQDLQTVILALQLLAKNDDEGYNLTDDEEATVSRMLEICGLDSVPFV